MWEVQIPGHITALYIYAVINLLLLVHVTLVNGDVIVTSTDEGLRGRAEGGNCARSYATLSELLPQFSDIGRFSLDKFGCDNNDPATLEEKFNAEKAVYHKSCVSEYNQQKLDRARKKRVKEEQGHASSDQQAKRRSLRSELPSQIDMGDLKCIFCLEVDDERNLCAAGTLHATSAGVDCAHNESLTDRLREKALFLNDSRTLNLLSLGTVAANEYNYHKQCLSAFNNKYCQAVNERQRQNSTEAAESFRKEVHFRKIIGFVQERRQHGEKSFEVTPLELMYLNLLDRDGIQHNQPHVGRFAERLREAFLPTGVEIRTVNKKVNIFFSTDFDSILHELSPASFVKSLLKMITPIRNEMSKVENDFKCSFPPGCQESSIPIQLQILCSLLIDGCDPQLVGFSQASMSIAQMIMYQFRKTIPSRTVSINRRHCKTRETPVPVYIGLKLYSCVRAKTLIQQLFSLGICISYDRCLEICDNIGSHLLQKYERDGLFIAGNLKLNLFTIIAKDNIDLNARSTKVKDHFHGISLSQLQFPSATNPGVDQEALYDLRSGTLDKKLKLPIDYVTFKEVPCATKSPLFVPVCTSNIDYLSFSHAEFDRGRTQEILWLDNAETNACTPWSSFHSKEIMENDKCPGVNALMPMINKKVSTLDAQYHIMCMVKKLICHINQYQIPIDVSDQPVFALSKELQLRLPLMFGPDQYICLLGDLHIEQSLLVMHGDLIKGSGLDTIMQHSTLSTVGGATAMVDVNHIKRSRYCLQVSVVVIYKLLKAAHADSKSHLTPFEWLDEMSQTSEMCFYWRTIILFELEFLVFLRSIREGNFQLYLETFFRFLKWYFALDKYNYARWATIYWFDLVLLEKRCPNEFNEFMLGNFSFLKTNTKFSRMALDQVHEQNNRYVKSVSGATSLINRQDESALVRWELCGPELCRILQEFESKHSQSDEQVSKHHEDTTQFQRDFVRDTQALFDKFPKNPFRLSELTVVNNTNTIFDDNVFYNISQLETRGTEQLTTFIADRLVKSKVSLDTKISMNHFSLPGNEESSKPRGSVVDKRLTMPFLTKLRAAIAHRRQHAKLLFESEIFDVAQSLSINGTDMYHGTKSTILQRFSSTEFVSPSRISSSAIIIELSPFFRKDITATNFDDYGAKLYEILMQTSVGYDRVDVIPDRYLSGSLKTLLREARGQGPVIVFDGKTPLPSNFRESFLKNSDNKDRLNSFIADRIFSLHTGERTLAIAKDTVVLTKDAFIAQDQTLTPNFAEEADQKIVRHMVQCVKSGIKHVVVRTVDTDVIISLLAYRYFAQNFDCEVLVLFVAGGKKICYNITKLSLELGEEICNALPFFHALTGCDFTSSFFNQGKCKFWDRWMDSQNFQALTDVFSNLSIEPHSVSDDQITVIEKYVCHVYYGDSSTPINTKRMNDFEHSTHNNLRLLPPSRLGLLEHVKRAAYYAGWINRQCVTNVELPDPAQWGWVLVEGNYLPIWSAHSDNASNADLVTMVCGCTTEKCSYCRCAKIANFECLQYCKCQRRCLHKSV